jgi:salicylate hydroxylase
MKPFSDPIVIVGGGIGGLAAALALATQGFRSLLLEQAPEFKEVGAGIQLGPNSWRALRAIGAESRAKRLAVFPPSLVMMDSVSCEQVAQIPLGGFEERFKAPYALIHRADLMEALVETAQASPLITLKTSCKVTGFEDRGSAVRVHTEDGTVYDTPALIGADGLWSSIRAALVGDGPPRVSGHVTYRAVLPIADVPAEVLRPDMVLWAGPKTHMVHYPLRGGELYNLVATFISGRHAEGWGNFGDPDELRESYKDTCAPVREMLGRITEWRMWALCDREPISEWSRGRVTLLGDAAHPTLQYLAQGAGMAMEDAVCIAACFAQSDSVETALQAYPAQRFLRTGRVTLTSRLYGEIFHAEGTRRLLRNDFVKRANYEGMAWLYDTV